MARAESLRSLDSLALCPTKTMNNLGDKLLIDKIKSAWDGVPYPGDDNIFTPYSYDDEGINDYFRGTTWAGHSVVSLRAHCGAILVFFTPVAYHYWLPAYLIASIEDPEELDVCLDSLVASFCPEDEGSFFCAEQSERLALLTNEQKLVVISTLEDIIEKSESETYLAYDEKTALNYMRSITNVA